MTNIPGTFAVLITVRLHLKHAKKVYLPFRGHYFIESNKCQKDCYASNPE